MTMENLKYRFDGGQPTQGATAIVGVLGSGNLEVLVEPAELGGACDIEVKTAARGFGTIWQAVLNDFFARHKAGDIRISVNDAGATPAIVSLRLDQAIESYTAKGKGKMKDQQ
jgi:malonate decarboxylase delta subunit